jgi:hypothetical protein
VILGELSHNKALRSFARQIPDKFSVTVFFAAVAKAYRLDV